MLYLKKRRLKFFSSFLVPLLLLAGGSSFSEANEPKRVVTLLPSLAEMVADILGGEDRIVGVSEFTDFPKTLKNKPSIGPYSKPNLETIISLKPDLVIASLDGSPQAVLARLSKLGIRVLNVGTESVEKLRTAYGALGEALGRKSEAMVALGKFDSELLEVRNRAKKRNDKNAKAKKSKLRVLLAVGDEPLYVAGGKSFLHEALVLVGAENVYGDFNQAYPRASVEDVLRRNPEVILLVSLGNDLTPFEKAKKRWERFPNLSAAKHSKVFISRSDSLVRPGPRFPSGVLDLERMLFPEETIQ